MYAIANTTVTILRGTNFNSYGDLQDNGTPVHVKIPAFISSPSQSPFRPIILGTTVYQPAEEDPSTVREILCILPGRTDVTSDDQILDETDGTIYQVELVTQPGRVAGLVPDMQLTLRRVTSTQSV